MEKDILELLMTNARTPSEVIAAQLGAEPAEVEAIIADLEAREIIKGYQPIVNEDLMDNHQVRALIEVKVTPQREGGFDTVAKRIAKFTEVKNLFLVSGSYDLLLEVYGNSLNEIAMFVASKLSTIEGVLSTSTAFTLKKYKESGRIMEDDEEFKRLQVCP